MNVKDTNTIKLVLSCCSILISEVCKFPTILQGYRNQIIIIVWIVWLTKSHKRKKAVY